jgi:hypothetical protein
MVSPYRTPAPVEPSPDLPLHMAPCACCAPCACRSLWTKGVTALSLFLLSGAAASVMALAWRVTTAPPPTRVHVLHVPVQAAQEPAARDRDAPHGRPDPRTLHDHRAGLPIGVRPGFTLGSLGRRTSRSPEELWARAVTLAGSGVDLILSETTLPRRSMKDLEHELGPVARIDPSGELPGVHIATLAPGSLARAVGLQEGDIVTAVNGYPLTRPETALEAYTSVWNEQAAVIELRRGGRAIVLRLRFGA